MNDKISKNLRFLSFLNSAPFYWGLSYFLYLGFASIELPSIEKYRFAPFEPSKMAGTEFYNCQFTRCLKMTADKAHFSHDLQGSVFLKPKIEIVDLQSGEKSSEYVAESAYYRPARSYILVRGFIDNGKTQDAFYDTRSGSWQAFDVNP